MAPRVVAITISRKMLAAFVVVLAVLELPLSRTLPFLPPLKRHLDMGWDLHPWRARLDQDLSLRLLVGMALAVSVVINMVVRLVPMPYLLDWVPRPGLTPP